MKKQNKRRFIILLSNSTDHWCFLSDLVIHKSVGSLLIWFLFLTSTYVLDIFLSNLLFKVYKKPFCQMGHSAWLWVTWSIAKWAVMRKAYWKRQNTYNVIFFNSQRCCQMEIWDFISFANLMILFFDQIHIFLIH